MVNLNINNENCLLKKKKVYTEIPVFLIYFAIYFADSITISFIRYRTCYVILGYNEPECAFLEGNFSSRATSIVTRKILPSALVISSTLSIIQSLIPPLLCFFVGPWCNQYGRKPVMLYSGFALIMQYLSMVFISIIPYLSPWYVLLSQILICASGGIPAFLTVVFAYLVDTVAEQDRGIRIALLEAARSFGTILGIATGLVTLHSTNYITVYSLSVCILILAWAFIWFYVPESIQVSKLDERVHKFFDFASLLQTAKTTFKARESYNRALLLSTLVLIISYIVATSGSNSVEATYFQNRFHWSMTSSYDYELVISSTTLIGGLICVYALHVKLNCTELISIVAGLLSLLAGSFVLAFATSTSIIHLGGCLQCFGPAVLSMAKSLLSKLVPHEEVSSIFAVVASLETVFTLVGTSIFAVMYHSTINSNPAMFLVVTTSLYAFQIILISLVLCIQRYWNPLTFRRIENEDC